MDNPTTNGILDGVHVCLGLPTYDGTTEYSSAIKSQSQASRKIRFTPIVEGSSCLPQVFNKLWIHGIGGYRDPFTHFAMLHTDVCPDPWWLDTLYDEMVATGATVISAIVPIKDTKGVTSTAIGEPGDAWEYRRITVTEKQKLPQTFSMEDLAASGVYTPEQTAGKCLLVNTGCMLIDLSWPHWFDKEPDGITMSFRFNMEYKIEQWPDGTWSPQFAPEDWEMSRYVANRGGKVVATQKVGAVHYGRQAYPSTAVWGQPTDSEIDGYNAKRRAAFAGASQA